MCMCSPRVPNIHHAWPHSLIAFQDLSKTPSHQNRPHVRPVHEAFPDTSTPSSAYPSVASCISEWEQRFPVDSDSQARHDGTPQYRNRTPAPCQSSSSSSSRVGRRRDQRWAPGIEAPAVTPVYGLDLEAGKRVSVCVGT